MNTLSKEKLKHIKQKRLERKKLFKHLFGLKDEDLLDSVIGERFLFTDEVAAKKLNNLPRFPRIKGIYQPRKKVAREIGWINKINLHDESFYTDSTAFLKGTQSSNPHNDYSQYFVDTGQRPQNFIRDTGLKHRFEEYPKLRELIRLKDKLIADTGSPPMYMQTDLSSFDLTDLNSKFDVIFVEPPLEEYNRMNGAVYDKYWTWSEIEALEIEHIAAPRSFIWLWCGSGHGLNEGRKCLTKWGFRRCEDICWIKTNKKRPGHNNLEPGALFQRTKEHCLMGIRGTVRRSTDFDFIHANVDIDLIIDEESEYGMKDKPVEIFHIMEHFCLGKRRLHLFGRDSTIRQGWLTIGSELTSSNFDSRVYNNFFSGSSANIVVPFNDEIERLRPKSPPPRSTKQNSGSGQSIQNNNSNCNVNSVSNSGSVIMNNNSMNNMQVTNSMLQENLGVVGSQSSNMIGGLSLNNLANSLVQSLTCSKNNPNNILMNNLAAMLSGSLMSNIMSTNPVNNSSSGGGRSNSSSNRQQLPSRGKYGPTPSLLPFPSSSSQSSQSTSAMAQSLLSTLSGFQTSSSTNMCDIGPSNNLNTNFLLDLMNKFPSNNNSVSNNNQNTIGNNSNNYSTGFNVNPGRNSNSRQRQYK